MAVDGDDVEVNDQPDADFDAGFSQAPDQTTTPEVEAEEEAVEEQTPEPKYAQITEDQLKDLMAKAAAVDEIKAESQRKFDNAFGQLGGLKQVIERFQRETPAGQVVQVSDDDFAEMKEDFPELAEMQIKGLNKVLSKIRGGGGAVDETLIEQIVQKRYGTELAEAREDALDSLHNIVPDWNSEKNAAALREWMEGQSEEVKALAASDKVRDAAKLLRRFRDSQQAKPAPAPSVSTRQRQLEAAVTPRSARGAAPEPVEEDDFEVGFNSARN